MKHRTLFASIVAATLSLLFALSAIADSSAAQPTTTTTNVSSVGLAAPAWPSVGASSVTWQAFSGAESAYATALANELTGTSVSVPGQESCVVDMPTVFSFNGAAVGAPDGVTLYGLTGGITCGLGNAVQSIRSIRGSYLSPRTAGCNSSSISFGTQYTGIASDCISGFPSGDAIGWFLDTSGSNKGHEELSNAGLSCAPGTLIGNSTDGTLTPGNGYYVMTPLDPNGDVNYGGTWWRDNGGGSYTNMVTVCDSV